MFTWPLQSTHWWLFFASGVVQGGIRCGDPDFPSIFANLDDEKVLEFVLVKTGLMKGDPMALQ